MITVTGCPSTLARPKREAATKDSSEEETLRIVRLELELCNALAR